MDILKCTGFVDAQFQQIIDGDILMCNGNEYTVEDLGNEYIVINNSTGEERGLTGWMQEKHVCGLTVNMKFGE